MSKESNRKRAYSKRPRIKAASISSPNVPKEKTSERAKQDSHTKWVNFFTDTDNIFPNDLAKRARRSATHGAVLRSKIIYATGQGFEYFINDEPTELEDDWTNDVDGERTSLHELYQQIQHNYISIGNAYIEVQRSGDSWFLFPHDATKIRLGKDRKKAYISAFWREIQLGEATTLAPVKEIELWNGKVDTKQKRFLIHLKQTANEYDYYGVPEYVGVLQWADIEYRIPNYNLTRFDNGFFPSALITLKGNPPQGMTAQKFVEKVKDNFTGEGNNDKMFVQLVSDESQTADIFEFSGVKEGEFKELQELATSKIINGHRWFPELAGIQTAGKLSGAKEIRNQYEIALNSLIKPEFQNPVLKCFNTLLKMIGKQYTVEVINVAPVGLAEMIDPTKVLSINEQRALLGYEEQEDGNNENGMDDGSGDSD